MSKWPIFRTPAAEQDLIDIWLYIAADNADAADRMLDRIGERIELLCEYPEAGAAREDIAPDLRMLPAGSYVVLYRLVRQRVEIIRVVHGARDTTALF